MLDALASTPLLTMMVVVGLGTLIGAIPLGPLRFGPAGALFVGLAIGAVDPRLGEGLGLMQTLGLALFVYTVGLAAGSGFFRDLRTQLPLMAGAALILAVVTGAAIAIGAVLGLNPALAAGSFSGALTSTPALAMAVEQVGTDEPAVGYALAYPVGVIVTILVISLILSRPWTSSKDPGSAARHGLIDISVEVSTPTTLEAVPGLPEGGVRLSYLARGGRARVVQPGEELRPGDRVVVVGAEEAVRRASDHLGQRVDEHLAHDRREVDYRRYVVSNRKVAGRTIGDLDIPGRFEGIVTRVRRGDLDLLATDDEVLELGDRVRVVVPRGRMQEVGRLLGDSERKVSEIDAFTLAVGLAIGLAVGLVSIPLPGGLTLALGMAAGPLVVGLVLGRLERTGPLVWGLPLAANLTIRQLGLLLFLGATGLASGQAFAEQALTGTGLRVVVAALLIAALAGTLFLALARVVGVSTERAAGGLAGFVGQPAILAYVSSRVSDERVEAGYAALFALGLILKILLVQAIVG